MKKRYKTLLVLSFVVAIGIFGMSRIVDSQVNNNRPDQIQDDTPIVDFNLPESANIEERDIRLKRGNKYRTNAVLSSLEDLPAVLDLPQSHTPPENPLPVQQSDLIVSGKIINSRAFVTPDKTGVYSEFEIKIDQIFKNINQSITTGLTINADRAGGYLRFPSGKIQKRGIYGHNLPRKNVPYIIFLKWNEDGRNFSIITGYEIQENRVLPLDGINGRNPQFLERFDRYKNADLNEFIANLLLTISNPQRGENN
jgi:hypothetical protein